MVCLLAFLLAVGLAAGQSAQPEVQTELPKADDIMARVAANQDRSEAVRTQYVYKQHIHIATHKPQTRMMREENADYDVVPLPDGTIQKQLKSLTGRYLGQNQVRGLSRRPWTRGRQHGCELGSQPAQQRDCARSRQNG